MIEEQLRAINAGQVRNGMTVGPAFATIRDLVVQHGRAYTIQPLPDGEWFRGLQACYANALQAAITGKWVYVEGFAIPAKGDLAVLHAWVTSPKNPLVAHDPTWRHSVQARLCTSNRSERGTLAFWTLGNSGGPSYAAKTRSQTRCGWPDNAASRESVNNQSVPMSAGHQRRP
jgi:hypothetical protein